MFLNPNVGVASVICQPASHVEEIIFVSVWGVRAFTKERKINERVKRVAVEWTITVGVEEGGMKTLFYMVQEGSSVRENGNAETSWLWLLKETLAPSDDVRIRINYNSPIRSLFKHRSLQSYWSYTGAHWNRTRPQTSSTFKTSTCPPFSNTAIFFFSREALTGLGLWITKKNQFAITRQAGLNTNLENFIQFLPVRVIVR